MKAPRPLERIPCGVRCPSARASRGGNGARAAHASAHYTAAITYYTASLRTASTCSMYRPSPRRHPIGQKAVRSFDLPFATECSRPLSSSRPSSFLQRRRRWRGTRSSGETSASGACRWGKTLTRQQNPSFDLQGVEACAKAPPYADRKPWSILERRSGRSGIRQVRSPPICAQQATRINVVENQRPIEPKQWRFKY